ncbi:MAG: 4-alpha-glucanotransferase [Gammaproteobacteria bacterium]|nr:MAG: 4-alpha-glucanotransferase [Gammaproteobacteria bacterium]RKZ96903.1 MAG: 4-alpha-glucanotransferase [Gammaproteobacteria bacterium]
MALQQAQVFQKRRAGVLLHITSLPSANLGEDAYHFVDFLHESGVSVWQMLPLGPTHSDGSPYQCLSAHASNTNLICMETVQHQSWIDDEGLQGDTFLIKLVHAYRQFMANANKDEKVAYTDFCQSQHYWLDDFVLFSELRRLNHTTAWFHWPKPLRDRQSTAIKKVRKERAESLEIRRFGQFLFYQQWHSLKDYANERGVLLFGDMPIFVAHDSADVWANPELFTLDKKGIATKVAGVPPDYFSETGQRWGNPLYRWQKHVDEDFLWWQQRIKTQLDLFDLIRIDHFRGFEACWEIPASCDTAMDGEWVKAPGDALFNKLVNTFGELPLVAEDLGIITDEVTALREKYVMPGMKILQFAFGDDASNPYLPHQHTQDSVSYTGTHDNNTTLGWFEELDDHTKARIYEYLGESHESMPWLLIRASLESVSRLAVIPMQDLLSLNGDHRMNVPGTTEGNWLWQFAWDMIDQDCAPKMKYLNELYGRS